MMTDIVALYDETEMYLLDATSTSAVIEGEKTIKCPIAPSRRPVKDIKTNAIDWLPKIDSDGKHDYGTGTLQDSKGSYSVQALTGSAGHAVDDNQSNHPSYKNCDLASTHTGGTTVLTLLSARTYSNTTCSQSPKDSYLGDDNNIFSHQGTILFDLSYVFESPSSIHTEKIKIEVGDDLSADDSIKVAKKRRRRVLNKRRNIS